MQTIAVSLMTNRFRGLALRIVAIATLLTTCLPGIAQEPKPNARPMLSEFIYDQASFPSCHASTIEESHGHLVAAWFGGTHEKHPDVGIWVARRIDGKWTDPVEVANGVVRNLPGDPKIEGDLSSSPNSVHRYPTWNPVLFQPKLRVDGKVQPLVLFYKVGPSPQTWWGMMTTSMDGGISWSSPTRLPEGILGPIKNKPVELNDGTWLCPSSMESDEEESKWSVHFEWTEDRGKTWKRTKALNDGVAVQAIQPSLLKLGEKHWLAIGRSRQDRIFELESKDDGRTWSELRLGSLPNNNSGIDAVTLADSRHLIVYNHVKGTPGEWGGKRTPLNVALSKDGSRWEASAILESEPGEFSYPAVIQTTDGMVHITYTWNRKKIKHVILDPKNL